MSRDRKGSFSRDNSEDIGSQQPSWLREYATNLQKLSVQPADRDRAMFDQISEIMGTKSRYATVDEAVTDLQKRTGLAQYLQMCEAEQNEMLKSAQVHSETHIVEAPKDENQVRDTLDPDSDEVQHPRILKEHPEIETFIDNCVKARNGFIHVPAVIENIRIVFKNENFSSDELEDKHLRKFINEKIIEEKSQHQKDESGHSDLGKTDYEMTDENPDAFAILMPVKSANDQTVFNNEDEDFEADEDTIGLLIPELKNAALAGNWLEFGNIMGQIDKAQSPNLLNAAESIRGVKYFKDPELSRIRVPVSSWLDFTAGYAKGTNQTKDQAKKDMEFTQRVLDKWYK